MNAPQRRLLRQNILLGFVLTLVAIGLDRGGVLHRLEGWFYDRRVSRCQYFTPAPTDKLVHLDIDDAATDSIGGWPWPRPLMAALIEELHHDGAATLAMDLLYKVPPSRYPAATRPAGEDDPDDVALSAAIKDFGNVVLAGSFMLGKQQQPSAEHRAVVDLLKANLELKPEDVNEAMRRKHLPAITPDQFSNALEEAANARVLSEPGALLESVDQLKAKLLPTLSTEYSNSV